jgi:hypothetical protein
MKSLIYKTTILLSSLSLTMQSYAARVNINVSGQISAVDGSYDPDLAVGDNMSATFIYDTDETQATSANTVGSTEPGHEFTSFYEFSSPAYGGMVTHTLTGNAFTSSIAGLIVNDDLSNGGPDLNNLIPTGTYDWIEILGSTTKDGPLGNPADGEEWTLALFSSDTSWITDGTLIPDDLPSSYTTILVGKEFDESENEIGNVLVDITSVSVTSIPEPSSALLLGLGALGIVLHRKRTK